MNTKLQTIANNALRIIGLCQEIGSGEYSQRGIDRRLDSIRESAYDIEGLLNELEEDKP